MGKRVMVDPHAVRHQGMTKKLTEEQIDEVVRLYNDGHTQKSIAEQFGITPPTVRRYLKERTERK